MSSDCLRLTDPETEVICETDLPSGKDAAWSSHSWTYYFSDFARYMTEILESFSRTAKKMN